MPQQFQKVCLNGHQLSVTVKRPSENEGFCKKCGAETTCECLNCHSYIKGFYEPDGIAYLGKRIAELPSYCESCGKPFPWTEKVLESAHELILLDDNLSDKDKEILSSTIPDLLVTNPRTPVSEAKFKLYFAKAGNLVKDSLYTLLVDVVSETTKKTLFPDL